jgi:hypothetical protein
VVNAFVAPSRGGDFEALVAVLDPEVVLRADAGVGGVGTSRVMRGVLAVANQALMFSHLAQFARLALVNGTPGLVTVQDGKPISVMGFTVRDGKIVELDILADPARLARLDLTMVQEG